MNLWLQIFIYWKASGREIQGAGFLNLSSRKKPILTTQEDSADKIYEQVPIFK